MSHASLPRHAKRKAHHRLSCPSSSDSSSSDRPHKKLAQSLNRLSLSPHIDPGPPDIDMRQRKSYEKDAFTTVIESLSTTTSESESEEDRGRASEAPFPRDEAHVTILSEIEKRLTKFPPSKVIVSMSAPDTALVLYRSPESMGLPKLARQRQEDLKMEMRRRIIEKRRGTREAAPVEPVPELDGYEADAEDLEGLPSSKRYGPKDQIAVEDMQDEDEEDDQDMMDLD